MAFCTRERYGTQKLICPRNHKSQQHQHHTEGLEASRRVTFVKPILKGQNFPREVPGKAAGGSVLTRVWSLPASFLPLLPTLHYPVFQTTSATHIQDRFSLLSYCPMCWSSLKTLHWCCQKHTLLGLGIFNPLKLTQSRPTTSPRFKSPWVEDIGSQSMATDVGIKDHDVINRKSWDEKVSTYPSRKWRSAFMTRWRPMGCPVWSVFDT